MFDFDQLPLELARDILLTAAEDNLYTDRAWLVKLATVSRTVYWLVNPVLYRIMVITVSNAKEIYQLAQDAQKQHIFAAVRRLHILRRVETNALPTPRLFTASGIHMDAHIDAINVFVCSIGSRISSVRVENTRLQTDSFPRSITHLTIDVRTALQHPVDDWLRDVLAPMSNVTHIAFEFIDGAFVSHPQMAELEALLRAALERRQTVQLAVRFSGRWIFHWPARASLLYTYACEDPRLVLWFDPRPMLRMFHQDAPFLSDAWEGRDVWTEAKRPQGKLI